MAATIHLDLNHDRDARRLRGTLTAGSTLDRPGRGVRAIRRAATYSQPLIARSMKSAPGRRMDCRSNFRALKEGQVNGVRVIEEAELSGIGLVSKPSYEGSRVEARARKHGRLPRWL